ncbi:hypothetical protein CDAR_228001 [Caerostris darwini]|uniref:Uncharacterized protein n=1 Tax=Caerostris darwini TaxID=1538125 RepID=A0AAV4VF64_9ARAC|nr:hypothetical protein CDAR_228001 [Caerostris darwini]
MCSAIISQHLPLFFCHVFKKFVCFKTQAIHDSGILTTILADLQQDYISVINWKTLLMKVGLILVESSNLVQVWVVPFLFSSEIHRRPCGALLTRVSTNEKTAIDMISMADPTAFQ